MNIVLTGERPTGKLHIGHYVGSLRQRLLLQDDKTIDKMYIMIADAQALTDNAGNVQKVKDNILEVALDYLSIGLDPEKVTIFIQSEISELTELTFYYMNLVSLPRLLRNPTVKEEIKLKSFENRLPVGFAVYPISQAADITTFGANIVPVGDDQLPMIEQTREIVREFNRIYGDTLIEPKAVLPCNKTCARLPGIDGKCKMSKSLNNCIYLSDSEEEVARKVKEMYTDPNHIRIEDCGRVEGNVVFTYLDAFCEDIHFKKFLPQYKNLNELKNHYRRGGLGDIVTKKFLNQILQEFLTPIREKRKELEKDKNKIFQMLFAGSDKARLAAAETLNKVRTAMGINYRNQK